MRRILQLLAILVVSVLLFVDLVKDLPTNKVVSTVPSPAPTIAPSPVKKPLVQAGETPKSFLGAIVDGKTLVIQIIEPLSAAEKAGLNGGDQLTQIDGKPLRGIADLKAVLDQRPKQATFTVYRMGVKPPKPERVKVVFGEVLDREK